MGCVESSEALSIEEDEPGGEPEEEEDAAPVARKATTAVGKGPAEKGKKRKKSSLKSKSGKKLAETQSLKERSESTKIHVIWRRWSVFSNRRDSIKSDKSQEGESAAGPSRKPPEEP